LAVFCCSVTDPTNLSHVAEAAGVSISTVSRVVNGFGWVKPETARKVEAAMATLNFDPATVRRGPRRGSRNGNKTSPTRKAEYIALLLVGEARRLLEHPVFASVLTGVSDRARRHGAMVVIEEVPDRASLEQFLSRPQIAGAIAIVHQNAQGLLDVIRRHMPVVWVMGEGARSRTVDHVAPDNIAVGAMAFEYLAGEMGCERVAFWTTLPERTIMGIRCVGFAQAALTAGRVAPAFVLTRDALLAESFGVHVTHSADVDELAALLISAEPRPTGIFVPADIQAAALQAVLRSRGVRPDSFRIISVDNEQRLLTTMDPRPATIDTQPTALGSLAAERLFHRMQHPDAVPASMLLAPRLVRPQDVDGASTAAGIQHVFSGATTAE
jgi:LacI family transcriptional regulator